MKNNILTITFSVILLLVISCSKENNNLVSCNDGIQNGNETGLDCGGDCSLCLSNIGINGKAQKGPFLNGSSITLSELDANFTPTGNDYNTQILDNSGSFSLNNISLSSSYATIRVDGFYFNEVCGQPSSSQITLNGIVDASNGSNINLNVLTHLEKARVEYLLSTGIAFLTAKTQAQSEILNIFEINSTSLIDNSELLDISGNSEGDAILIAISSILQGFRSESQFSDLMANIITDIRTDGILNSSSLGSQLLAHATLLDTVEIANNIEDRYNDLGISISVPSFGEHINDFLNNSSFQNNFSVIEYPSSALNGLNILDLNNITYINNTNYSLSASLPNDCINLKIKISKNNGNCNGCWYYNLNSIQNWSITTYDFNTNSQEFTNSDLNTDLNLFFEQGTYQIEYFENDHILPTRTKNIIVN
jgi:hypothetical protein